MVSGAIGGSNEGAVERDVFLAEAGVDHFRGIAALVVEDVVLSRNLGGRARLGHKEDGHLR